MLETAIEAASEAGKLLRRNFGSSLSVNQTSHHDIKLAIDEQAQNIITRVILSDFSDHCIYGEEGISGRADSDTRWVVDPLDGTVNYFYNIPHYAVSIAVQQRHSGDQWRTVAGVVLVPELEELFASEKGMPAMLNNQPIHVSDRSQVEDAIIGIGFFKSQETIKRSLRDFQNVVGRVRKMRLMGSAALDVVYVACGRFDAYIEYGIKLWDIAAGQHILENAGGQIQCHVSDEPDALDVRMWNGRLPLNELLG